MSSIENVTSWMVDSYGRNVTIFNFQLQMPDYIVAIYMLYLSMCMAIGVPGNSIVVVVFLKNKPKSNADWYIFCTAAFDLVCLLVTAPMYIVIQTKLWDVVDVNILCKTLNFLGQFVTFSESCLICAMGIERFIKVCRPSSSFGRVCYGKYIVLIITLSAFFLCLPNLFFSWMGIQKTCFPYTQPPWIASAFFLLTVSFFIVMFGIVSFSYISVALRLLQTGKQTRQNTINSRRIVRCNQVSPLPCQTECTEGTSRTIPTLTNHTTYRIQNDAMIGLGRLVNPSFHQVETTETSFLKICHATIINEQNKNCRQDLPVVTVLPLAMSSAQKARLVRTTKVSFFISLIFIISWLPVWVYTIMAFTNTTRNVVVGFFIKQSYLLNTFMNPILCLLFNPSFRNNAKRLFCKKEP